MEKLRRLDCGDSMQTQIGPTSIFVEVGSQVTSLGVPRSPSDVTREPKLELLQNKTGRLNLSSFKLSSFKTSGLDSQVTQFSVPRSLNDVTRESKL